MTDSEHAERYQAADRFVSWLADRVTNDARGSGVTQIDVDPRGSYWLGRLAPLVEIMNSTLGERAERLEPCALGLRVLPARERVTFTAIASFVVWRRVGQQWQKPPRIHVEVPVELPDKEGSAEWGRAALSDAIDAVAPGSGLAATIRTELSRTPDGKRELSIELVNDSDPDHKNAGAHAKGRLFECSLQVRNLATHEYLLEELPDSFRYDRRVAA